MEINEAQQFVSDIQEQKKLERERAKPSPNKRMVEDAKDYVESYPFWCENCGDVELGGHKVWHRLYGDWIATYRAYCDCGEELIRYITHRDSDPYYYLSDKINSDRNEFAAEMLQADDYGFKTLYGEPYAEYVARQQKHEERIFNKRRELGFT